MREIASRGLVLKINNFTPAADGLLTRHLQVILLHHYPFGPLTLDQTRCFKVTGRLAPKGLQSCSLGCWSQKGQTLFCPVRTLKKDLLLGNLSADFYKMLHAHSRANSFCLKRIPWCICSFHSKLWQKFSSVLHCFLIVGYKAEKKNPLTSLHVFILETPSALARILYPF